MTNKTYMTYTTYNNKETNLIPPHGGYKSLESYKMAEIVCDATVFFTRKWIRSLKQKEQMDGAGRSGKQCIAEGSLNSGTSKKLELKLIGNARGSFGELLEDFEDFVRQHGLNLWTKDSEQAKNIRSLAYMSNRSYMTYKSYIESENPEIAANTMICLIHQTNFLLDRQLQSLGKQFMEQGGFSERLYRERKKYVQ